MAEKLNISMPDEFLIIDRLITENPHIYNKDFGFCVGVKTAQLMADYIHSLASFPLRKIEVGDKLTYKGFPIWVV